MKILAVGDEKVPLLYDYFKADRWQGDNAVDLLLSCGDLDPDYMSFLVSMFNVPAYCIPGNHDDDRYPADGWMDISGRIVTVQGIRVAGFPGSIRYATRDVMYQYSEAQMRRKTIAVGMKAWMTQGIDIAISHAAPAICPHAYTDCPNPLGGNQSCQHTNLPEHLDRCPDAGDLCHQGFLSLRSFLLQHHPTYWLHGHNHLSYARTSRVHTVATTQVINVYGHILIHIDPASRTQGIDSHSIEQAEVLPK